MRASCHRGVQIHGQKHRADTQDAVLFIESHVEGLADRGWDLTHKKTGEQSHCATPLGISHFLLVLR